MALLLLPEKGAVSGDRPHCALMLILPNTVEKRSTSSADSVFVEDDVKMDTCWPYLPSREYLSTSSRESYGAMGITGPNCSSSYTRMSGVTG